MNTKENIKLDLLHRFAGGLSGLLLAVTNFYPVLSLLQLIAFLPVFYLIAKNQTSRRYAILMGFYIGLGYSLPQMISLRFPMPISLALLSYFIIIMIIFTSVSAIFLTSSGLLGALAVGSFLVILDWINFTLIPIWGTAQSLARPWSYYPELIAFSSLTGITGVVFISTTLQALVVKFLFEAGNRTKLFTAIIVILLFVCIADTAILIQKPAGSIKVAAVGWTLQDETEADEIYSKKGFDTLFEQPVAKAATQGAKLIVTPELGFCFVGENFEQWAAQFSEIARKYKIFLVIGYNHVGKNENRLIFINPDGEVVAEYTKTYLTAFEDFNKGTGEPTIVDINGFQMGAMICHDDNFTKLSRGYGRKKVSLMVVPTLDWKQVKNAHFQSSIHRAIEAHYAIVRASINGISAIISPLGKIIKYKDHVKDGPGVIIAEVPIYQHMTLFSLFGHWPVVLCTVYLTSYLGWCYLKKVRRIKD